VLGTPSIEWWQIYIVLERFVNHYSSGASNKGKKQDRAFEELQELHGIPSDRIKALHQTANYYRHASATLPEVPWGLLDAGEFVKKAVRHWAAEHKARRDQEKQNGDPHPGTE